jgi:hypothetical protein
LRVVAFTQIAFLALTVIGSLEQTCHPQSPGSTANGPDASQNSLSAIASAEEKLGSTLTYIQSYRSGGKLVFIKGTVYAGISSFTANKCELTIGTTVVDRYSGQFDKSMIKKTQNVYNYSGVFRLTQDIADSVRLTDAPPSPLEGGTHPICTERQACAFHWVEIRAKNKEIKLTSTTNDVAGYDGFVTDFDGVTDRLWIPVSSTQTGLALVSLLRNFAATCEGSN